MRNLVLLLLVFTVAACANARRTELLRIGMTKAEAIAVMGNPVSVAADRQGEVLYYRLIEGDVFSQTRTYFVRMVDGKVESFGRLNELVIPSESPTPLPAPTESPQ